MKWSLVLIFGIIAPLTLLLVLTPQQVTFESFATLPTGAPFQAPVNLAIFSSHSSNADLYILDENSLSIQLIAQNIGIANPAWSPDHQRLAIAQASPNGDLQIAIINADGTNRHPIYTIPYSQLFSRGLEAVRTISWSPDGTRIAFDLVLDVTFIYIISTDGTLVQTIGPDIYFVALSTWLHNGNELAYGLYNGTCHAMYVQNIVSLTDRFLVQVSENS